MARKYKWIQCLDWLLKHLVCNLYLLVLEKIPFTIKVVISWSFQCNNYRRKEKFEVGEKRCGTPKITFTFPWIRWRSTGLCKASKFSFLMILGGFFPLKMLFSPLCWFTFSTFTSFIWKHGKKHVRKTCYLYFHHSLLENKMLKQ